MSNKKMLTAAAWLSTWSSTYAEAVAPGEADGVDAINSPLDLNDEPVGKGKGKGKGKGRSRDPGPSFNPDFPEPPLAQPRRVDAPIDGTMNNGLEEAKGGPGGTEGAVWQNTQHREPLPERTRHLCELDVT